MINFNFPEGAQHYDAAAFDQSGNWIFSGHREECEQYAQSASGLYCWWVNDRPVIRVDFESAL